jgi:hypothetical protein
MNEREGNRIHRSSDHNKVLLHSSHKRSLCFVSIVHRRLHKNLHSKYYVSREEGCPSMLILIATK